MEYFIKDVMERFYIDKYGENKDMKDVEKLGTIVLF